jgi:hypothetical protein
MKRPHADARPVTAAAGTAWAFTRRENLHDSGAGREGGAALARGIGLVLPDTAVVASMQAGPGKGRRSLGGADRGPVMYYNYEFVCGTYRGVG